MLNCCIERKTARESGTKQSQLVNEDSSTDEEEFFDCATETQVKHSMWNQPVGRLTKFENFKLIQTGEPLYIPVTQEPVIKTEDQLEEDTDLLLKLGSDAQGSELRARIMSASLLSDMESFKAANPGSELEDFIRWYSPRDWIEDEGFDKWGQKKGHLSSRMLLSNNTWVEMWQNAKPVPANRQKRLFDDTREAEKVLHFLESRTLSQISEMLLPVLAHASARKIANTYEEVLREIPTSFTLIKQIFKTVERLSREGKIQQKRYEILIQDFTQLELLISKANSLCYKLNPQGGVNKEVFSIVCDLLNGKEVEIIGRNSSSTGEKILTIFNEAQKSSNLLSSEQNDCENKTSFTSSFPQPFEREFVMRVSAPRPAAYSSKCPQFLRAILNKNEFRLVGAFSEDMVFF